MDERALQPRLNRMIQPPGKSPQDGQIGRAFQVKHPAGRFSQVVL